MSAEFFNAVYSTTAASAYFQGVLAKDPQCPSDPAILLPHVMADSPVYDALTYSVSMATVDKRFDAAIQGGRSTPVESYRLDFGYWTQQIDAARIEAAFKELDRLFRFAPGFDIKDSSSNVTGHVFKVWALTRQPNLYDKTLHVLYGLCSYQVMAEYNPVNG